MFLLIILGLLVSNTYSETIYCTGHDACKNKIWNGEYDIFCGASNSERTCKSTTLNCGVNKDCTIKTQGSGHDAYQNSIVNAKESNSFKLTCQASGLRDCQSITIWCPQSAGSTCECVSCPSSVNMKCVSGVSCDSVSNANIDYVEADEYQIPDTVWKKDTSHQGKRPDCMNIVVPPSDQNYKWGTLQGCKNGCIKEPTGRCNIISRYGEGRKSLTEPFHCRFYACEDPDNFNWVTQGQWGNYADECHTYIMPVRHYTVESRIQNKTITNYKNETIYNYINISDYFYDDSMIKSICFEGQYKYYSGATNEGWTTKSWQLGCNQYGSGYTSLNQCKSKCNCNQTPSSYSSHSKYRQCSKINAASNYIPCRQNACSGGNCCSRSTAICKTACKAYHAIKFSGELITYKDVDVPVYKDIFVNKTRYINKTRENIINKTRYLDVTKYFNKTRYINKTRENIINVFKNITRILERNITNYFNKTIINELCNVISNPDIISSNNKSKDSYTNIVNKETSATNITCDYSSNISDREKIILIISLLIILLLIFRICYVDFCCDYKLESKSIITKPRNVTVQLPSWDDCESLERMPSENIIVTNAIPISG